jgi:hypothetical protein
VDARARRGGTGRAVRRCKESYWPKARRALTARSMFQSIFGGRKANERVGSHRTT